MPGVGVKDRGGPCGPVWTEIRQLEDVVSFLARAHERLEALEKELKRTMVTFDDADVLLNVWIIRDAIENAQAGLLCFHPDALPEFIREHAPEFLAYLSGLVAE